MIIVMSLYRLKLEGSAWREMLDRVTEKNGFQSCSQSGADVYIKKGKKKNGDLY